MYMDYEKYEPFFGVWKIKREIGRGSFGRVYEVERKEYDTTYQAAVKFVTIQKSSDKQNLITDVINEINLMSRLKGNSNIVSYEDHQIFRYKDHVDFMIRMELLTPLNEYIKRNPFTSHDVVQMGIDICRALELCEKKNIIHRDIKPSNIMVSSEGNYKLGDFGIAHMIERQEKCNVVRKGTCEYMAPEMYKGLLYGPNVDLYALGLVLYRLLNNNILTFDKTKRLSGEKLERALNVDDRIWRIIEKACEYDAQKRYSSASGMKEELERELVRADHKKDLRLDFRNNGATDEKSSSSSDCEATIAEHIDDQYKIQLSDQQLDEKEDHALIESLMMQRSKKVNRGKTIILIASISTFILIAGVTALFFYTNRKVTVPVMVGLEKEEAEKAARERELVVSLEKSYDDKVDEGTVISQNIEQGEKVKLNTTICLVISKGIRYIEAENYVGLNSEQAQKQAKDQEVKIKLEEEYSDEIEKGVVIEQNKAPGTKLKYRDTIVLKLSKGPELVDVPDFMGKNQSDILNISTEAGLRPEFVWEKSDTIEQGYILRQETAPATKVKKGTSILITLSSGKPDAENISDNRRDAEQKYNNITSFKNHEADTGTQTNSQETNEVPSQMSPSTTVPTPTEDHESMQKSNQQQNTEMDLERQQQELDRELSNLEADYND